MRELFDMIKQIVVRLANDVGVKLSDVRVVDGETVGCLDVYMLKLAKDKHLVQELIFQGDIDDYCNYGEDSRLVDKIRSALSHLKLLLEG